MSDLLPHTTAAAVCGYRDAALAKMREAVLSLAAGFHLAEEARELAAKAHGTDRFHLTDRTGQKAYAGLFQAFDADASLETYRQHVDASVWMHLLRVTGASELMDRTAKEELYTQLQGEVPEVTPDNIQGTFKALAGDSRLIFQRGLARAFSDLDRRFRSHDAFKLGDRIILTNVFDGWGSWNYHGHARDTLADVERVFAILDGKSTTGGDPVDVGALARAIDESRRGQYGARQGCVETDYFRVRTFKNGNAHLWFRRDDLVEKANLELADYYGEVLPDAVPPKHDPRDLRSTELSTKLQFYATPPEVVTRLLTADLYLPAGARVLEPSAGEGAIVRGLLRMGRVGRVDAVEVHPDRVSVLRGIGDERLEVHAANFLTWQSTPVYDLVVMNPPFHGTHWMAHVTHAFEMLRVGGTLVAVLPVTAEVGTTKKHVTFRAWAEGHSRYDRIDFRDLPAESFASSGTRVNTVVLTMYRREP